MLYIFSSFFFFGCTLIRMLNGMLTLQTVQSGKHVYGQRNFLDSLFFFLVEKIRIAHHLNLPT